MTSTNYRLIDVDNIDPEALFPDSLLHPEQPHVSTAHLQGVAQQVRQLLQRGDKLNALKGALTEAPYGADEQGKLLHLQTVLEILASIKSVDMGGYLKDIYGSEGGVELCDVLMKYLYKGMAVGGSNMSVLLSWHERVVEVAGEGSIVRTMTDRRTV